MIHKKGHGVHASSHQRSVKQKVQVVSLYNESWDYHPLRNHSEEYQSKGYSRNQNISKQTSKILVKTFVFPVICRLPRHRRSNQKTDVELTHLEMWVWRRMLHKPRAAKRTIEAKPLLLRNSSPELFWRLRKKHSLREWGAGKDRQLGGPAVYADVLSCDQARVIASNYDQ